MSIQLSLKIAPAAATVTADELERLVLELKSEIEQSQNPAVRVDETKRINKGALGPEWLPELTIILSSAVGIEVIKGLVTIVCEWMKRRKPVTVVIVGPRGSHMIAAENMSSEDIQRIASKIG
jgi:hypothetical protein